MKIVQYVDGPDFASGFAGLQFRYCAIKVSPGSGRVRCLSCLAPETSGKQSWEVYKKWFAGEGNAPLLCEFVFMFVKRGNLVFLTVLCKFWNLNGETGTGSRRNGLRSRRKGNLSEHR